MLGEIRGARLRRLDPSKRVTDTAEITNTRWGRQRKPPQATHKSSARFWKSMQKRIAPSPRQSQCRYDTNAQTIPSDEPNSVALRAPRSQCGAASGASTSCRIALILVLCTWRGDTHSKRRRGRAVLPCRSANGRGTAAGSVFAAPVQASRAARRTTLCPGVPHGCVPAQRARSTFTKLPSDAFAGNMQQHKQVRA